jgi:hypothetical protein
MSKKTGLKPDPVLKDFWSNNSRFADLFNQVLFQGKPVINPDKLSDKDTEESTVYIENEQIKTISRARDLIKQYAENMDLVLIAVENQMKIHYAMPVRSMLNESLRYTRQCKNLEQRHRKAGDLKETEEFLSGMARTDRLYPVVNLVIYYGEKPWDGPVSLSDMMDIPSEFESFFSNYKTNLIEVRNVSDMNFQNEDNQDFFTLIKEFYANDGHMDLNSLKEKFWEKEIYWETMAAVGAATGSEKLVEYAQEREGGRLNMCTALDNLMQEKKLEGKREGIQEGKREGIQEGKREGIQEGKREGIQEGKLAGMIIAYRELNLPDDIIVKKLQDKFHMSYEKIQEYLKQN